MYETIGGIYRILGLENGCGALYLTDYSGKRV